MTSAESVENDQASRQTRDNSYKIRVLKYLRLRWRIWSTNQPTAHSSIFSWNSVCMCVRVCASTETHFMIKKRRTSECVYKYQQICLILYTEVQNSRRCTQHEWRVHSGGAFPFKKVATAVNVRWNGQSQCYIEIHCTTEMCWMRVILNYYFTKWNYANSTLQNGHFTICSN